MTIVKIQGTNTSRMPNMSKALVVEMASCSPEATRPPSLPNES